MSHQVNQLDQIGLYTKEQQAHSDNEQRGADIQQWIQGLTFHNSARNDTHVFMEGVITVKGDSQQQNVQIQFLPPALFLYISGLFQLYYGDLTMPDSRNGNAEQRDQHGTQCIVSTFPGKRYV